MVFYDLFLLFLEGVFGNERVHLLAQGVLAHPQNPQFSTPAGTLRSCCGPGPSSILFVISVLR